MENRRCAICKDRTLENEYHFILKCDALKDLRTTYFLELHEKVGVKPSETEGSLVKQLLVKDALKISGRHLEMMYLRRRELLYSNDNRNKEHK